MPGLHGMHHKTAGTIINTATAQLLQAAATVAHGVRCQRGCNCNTCWYEGDHSLQTAI